jgi:hypothetical protein
LRSTATARSEGTFAEEPPRSASTAAHPSWPARAIRHTDAPVELTVDVGADVVRIEVRDDDASLPGSGRVVAFELREASTDV